MRISRDAMAKFQPLSTDDRLKQHISNRDYSGLNKQDTQIRLWLPEAAKLALIDLAKFEDISITAYITEYFVTYLYGYHELLRMRQSCIGLYEPIPPMPNRRYCAMDVKPDPEPNLGKNIYALKIFIPNKIKQDLQRYADKAGVTLGYFARRVICAHLFGQYYGPSELIVISAEDARLANEWEISI